VQWQRVVGWCAAHVVPFAADPVQLAKDALPTEVVAATIDRFFRLQASRHMPAMSSGETIANRPTWVFGRRNPAFYMRRSGFWIGVGFKT
jgi:hypothetical protein